jgi:hypothetical protein
MYFGATVIHTCMVLYLSPHELSFVEVTTVWKKPKCVHLPWQDPYPDTHHISNIRHLSCPLCLAKHVFMVYHASWVTLVLCSFPRLCWQHPPPFFFRILSEALLTEITDSETRWEVTSLQIRFVIFAIPLVMCNNSSFRHK